MQDLEGGVPKDGYEGYEEDEVVWCGAGVEYCCIEGCWEGREGFYSGHGCFCF